MKRKIIIATVIIASVVGCKTPEQRVEDNANAAEKRLIECRNDSLPNGSTCINDLGNGWCTFMLNDKKFMLKVSRTMNGFNTYTITQIQ